MKQPTDTENAVKKRRNNSQVWEVWRRFKKNKIAMVGLVVFLILCLIAVFADVIIPYSAATTQIKDARLFKPCAEYLFGTDNLGRDMFARVIHGSRYSISLAIVISLVSLLISSILGGIAGYYGGTLDNIIMRILDVLMCIPSLMLALCIVAALGANLVNLLIAMTIGQIPGTVRLVRSSIMSVSGSDYIEAARCHGASDLRIIAKYIIPNALGPIIVDTTVNASRLIITCASMSFLGLGIQPPAPEWGNLLAGAREYMRIAPWLLYIPGAALVVTALSINLIGDGLRDALDPKIRD